jgi:hypothetical protein
MATKKTVKPAGRSAKASANKRVAAKAGRGNPPKEHQFKPNQSGNPKGRPKGSKNLATLIADAAYDQIVLTTKSGEKRKMNRAQATTLQLANKAAQGNDMRAVLKFMDWIDEIERRAAEARPTEMPIGEADLEVLRTVYDRMKLCEPPKDP